MTRGLPGFDNAPVSNVGRLRGFGAAQASSAESWARVADAFGELKSRLDPAMEAAAREAAQRDVRTGSFRGRQLPLGVYQEAYNISAERAVLTRASLDARARLNELRSDPENMYNVESFREAATNAAQSYVDGLGPAADFSEAVFAAWDSETQYLLDNVANDARRRSRELDAERHDALITQFEDRISALANSGDLNSDDGLRTIAEWEMAYRAMADDPIHGVAPQARDAYLDRRRASFEAQAALSSVEDVYRSRGEAGALEWVDEIIAGVEVDGEMLTLSAQAQGQFRSAARTEIRRLVSRDRAVENRSRVNRNRHARAVGSAINEVERQVEALVPVSARDFETLRAEAGEIADEIQRADAIDEIDTLEALNGYRADFIAMPPNELSELVTEFTQRRNGMEGDEAVAMTAVISYASGILRDTERGWRNDPFGMGLVAGVVSDEIAAPIDFTLAPDEIETAIGERIAHARGMIEQGYITEIAAFRPAEADALRVAMEDPERTVSVVEALVRGAEGDTAVVADILHEIGLGRRGAQRAQALSRAGELVIDGAGDIAREVANGVRLRMDGDEQRWSSTGDDGFSALFAEVYGTNDPDATLRTREAAQMIYQARAFDRGLTRTDFDEDLARESIRAAIGQREGFGGTVRRGRERVGLSIGYEGVRANVNLNANAMNVRVPSWITPEAFGGFLDDLDQTDFSVMSNIRGVMGSAPVDSSNLPIEPDDYSSFVYEWTGEGDLYRVFRAARGRNQGREPVYQNVGADRVSHMVVDFSVMRPALRAAFGEEVVESIR